MIRSFLAALLLAVTIGTASAKEMTEAAFQAMAAEVLRPVMERYDSPGIAVGLTIEGRAVFYTAGEAVRATHAPVTTDTIFELGSVSKLFNVALAALAQERGLLSFSDPVSAHLPALKGSAFDTITLLNLATHTTAGLPLQVPDGVRDAGPSLIAYLKTFTPKGDPNATRSYSNVSIGLLGQIAAERFGAPYAEAVETMLFKGLGLTSTFVAIPREAEDRYAFGYAKDGDRPVRVGPGVLDAEAYGVKSTVRDMTRFLAAHLGAVELPKDLGAALTATRTGFFETRFFVQDLVWEQYAWPVDPARLKAGNSSDMALQPQPVTRLAPPTPPATTGAFLNKTGSTNGFGAYVALLPGEKLGIVILANRNYPNDARAAAAVRLIEKVQAATR